MAAVHLMELTLIVFMVHKPLPSCKSKYHGDVLEKSFIDIVINNIYSKNFPKAHWNTGIGSINSNCRCNRNSLQELLNVASHYNLLQTVTEGTRDTWSGDSNILDLILTNNHYLITNVQVQS